MNINTATKVVSIKKKNGIAQVTVEDSKGGNPRVLEAEMVIVSIGRKPYVTGLGAKDIGIRFNQYGQIKINS